MKLEKWIKVLFYTVFSLKALESMTIFPHGDALNYHLVVPRLVLESGWNNVFDSFFAVFLSGYYELIYFLPNLLFGNHVYAQISGQLLNFWLSLGLSCWLLIRYIPNKNYAMLAGLSLITLSKGNDFLLYAKNDAFLATLCLWLFLDILHKKVEDWNPLFFGLFYGLIPSIKLNGLFFLAPLFLYIAFRKKFDLKFLAKIATVAFFTHLPVFLIKNHFLGGAIFFPALLGIFPGDLSENTIQLFNGYTNAKITLSNFGKYIALFFTGKIIFLSFPFLFFKVRKNPKAIVSIFVILTNFILILLMNGGVYSERFLFPMLFTMIGAFFYLLEKVHIPPKAILFLSLLILADSKIDKVIKRDIKVLKYLTLNSQEMTELRKKEIPLSTVWDHIKVKKNQEFTYVFSDNFVQTFYSPQGIRVDMYPSSPNTFPYKKCEEEKFLDRFSYFIMRWTFSSPCNEIIKKQTKEIYRIGPYVILQR